MAREINHHGKSRFHSGPTPFPLFAATGWDAVNTTRTVSRLQQHGRGHPHGTLHRCNAPVRFASC
jgi:hypothetical protein